MSKRRNANLKILDRIEHIRRRATVCGPEVAIFLDRLNEERCHVRHILTQIHDIVGKRRGRNVLDAVREYVRPAVTKPPKARDQYAR